MKRVKFRPVLFVLLVLLSSWLLISCSGDATEPTLGPAADADKAMPITAFIVHGDTHSGYDTRNPDVPAVHTSFVSQFTNVNPDLIFNVGDVVDILSPLDNPYTEAHAPVWGNLMQNIPTYAALGNHDDADQFIAYFDNVPGPRYFVTDPASRSLFIVLDIPQCDDTTNLSVQEAFLINTLADPAHADLPHRFVFFHVPPYTLGFRGACDKAALWNDMMESYGVDIVFSGHTHAYEHFRGGCASGPQLPGQPPAGPSASSIHYIVTGRSGAYAQYPVDSPTCGECANCIKSIYTHNYVYVVVGAKNRISVNVRDENGSILDYFQIVD